MTASPDPPPLIIDDFTSRTWERGLDDTAVLTSDDVMSVFRERAEAAEQDRDNVGRRCFGLLWLVMSFALRPDEAQPLRPRIDGIPSPKELDPSQLAIITELAPLATHPELKARLCDIAWIVNRNYPLACSAIESYVNSAMRLESAQRWPYASSRFRRAAGLAASLGRGGATEFERVTNAILETLDVHHDSRNYAVHAVALIQLLVDHRFPDSRRLLTLTEHWASVAESESDWPIAQQHWRLMASLADAVGETCLALETRIRVLEHYVNMADSIDLSDASSHLIQAGYLQRAVEGFRRMGRRERADELHARMLEVQARAVPLLTAHSQELDVSGPAEEARRVVSNRTLYSALSVLAWLCNPPSTDRLRERSDKYAESNPTLHMFDTVPLDAEGRSIGVKPSRLSGDPAIVEEARIKHMHEIARRDRIIDVLALIDPARRQILREHSPSKSDFRPILIDHPFVGAGREDIYARGLIAGLEGDFLTSTHILIPQLEQSLRALFRRSRLIESAMNSIGEQEAHNLNTLLFSDDIYKLFKSDYVFVMRGVLVHKFGDNLRNRMAHGLMDSSEFENTAVQYLWWLILRMILSWSMQSYEDMAAE